MTSSIERLDINEFDFSLPACQIAQFPAKSRAESRLLVVEASSRQFQEIVFSELKMILRPGDLLVCNDTKVIPARIIAQKSTGGRVEILVERIINDRSMWAQMRSRRPIKTGNSVFVDEFHEFQVSSRRENLFLLTLKQDKSIQSVLNEYGRVPLPPYITRPLEDYDAERYQTVYARYPGSVAAPTAGLHFNRAMISELSEFGVNFAYITLHVGAGTFAPIRDGDINKHRLHREMFEISQSVCDCVHEAKKQKSRVIAVGTTSMRALETASDASGLCSYSGETELFIKPGFKFRTVDALITNFHLPRSTLLMLVCAFGDTQRIMSAYRLAVKKGFRFYSYGDAMFVELNQQR